MITRRDWWLGIGVLSALLLIVAYLCLPSFRVNKAIVQAATDMQNPDNTIMQTAALKDASKGQVGIFKSAIKLYKFHTQKLPPTLEALFVAPADVKSRWNGPYMDGPGVPLDSWDHEFKYSTTAKHSSDGFDVWSMGPDGKDGTADDIGNWE